MVLKRLPYVPFEGVSRLDLFIHLWRKEPVQIPPIAFRPVHGQVGILEELLRLGLVIGVDGDSQAGTRSDLLTVEHDRLGDQLEEFSCPG